MMRSDVTDGPKPRRISFATLALGLLLIGITFVPVLIWPGEVTGSGADGTIWRWNDVALGGGWGAWLGALAPAGAGAICIAGALVGRRMRAIGLLTAGLLLWLYQPLASDATVLTTYRADLLKFYLTPLLPALLFAATGALIGHRRRTAGIVAIVAATGYALWITTALAAGDFKWRFLAPLDEMVFYGKPDAFEAIKTLSGAAWLGLTGVSLAASIGGMWVRRRAIRSVGVICGLAAAVLLCGLMFALGRNSLVGQTHVGLLDVLRYRSGSLDRLCGLGVLVHHTLPQIFGMGLIIAGAATKNKE